MIKSNNKTLKVYNLNTILENSIIDNPVQYKRILKSKNKWKRYELTKSIKIKLTNGRIITIKKGFRWDLSSVPRLFWSLLAPSGDFEIAALIHDYLYINSPAISENWFKNDSAKARKFADKEMLIWSRKVNSTKRISIKNIDNYVRYYGVRLFGRSVWEK